MESPKFASFESGQQPGRGLELGVAFGLVEVLEDVQRDVGVVKEIVPFERPLAGQTDSEAVPDGLVHVLGGGESSLHQADGFVQHGVL